MQRSHEESFTLLQHRAEPGFLGLAEVARAAAEWGFGLAEVARAAAELGLGEVARAAAEAGFFGFSLEDDFSFEVVGAVFGGPAEGGFSFELTVALVPTAEVGRLLLVVPPPTAEVGRATALRLTFAESTRPPSRLPDFGRVLPSFGAFTASRESCLEAPFPGRRFSLSSSTISGDELRPLLAFPTIFFAEMRGSDGVLSAPVPVDNTLVDPPTFFFSGRNNITGRSACRMLRLLSRPGKLGKVGNRVPLTTLPVLPRRPVDVVRPPPP